MRRAILLVAGLCSVILSPPSAQADSELQKFLSGLPWHPGARQGIGSETDKPGYPGAMYFSSLSACHLITRIKVTSANKGATLKEIEDAIFEKCERDERKVVDELAKLGMPPKLSRHTVSRYNSLAATERRLLFEGKPIPGYRQGNEDAKLSDWYRRADAAKSAYVSCIEDALRNLIPTSTDPSDIVADAAIGICSSKRNELATVAREIISSSEKTEASLNALDRQLRSTAIGRVTAARAEIHRRQQLQQQTPNQDQPAIQEQRRSTPERDA